MSAHQHNQQFVLRWHYHESTLLQNLPFLLDNDILSDVTLSVAGHNLKAHRIVLAMCSVYFLQLFQELKNTTHPVVVLHNVNADDIRAVLSFIYRGQCVVSKGQLPNLLSVAKLLKIQGLCDMKVPEKEVKGPEYIPQPRDNIPEKCLKVNDRNESNQDGRHLSPAHDLTTTNVKQIPDSVSATDFSSDPKRCVVSPVWEKPPQATQDSILSTEDPDNPPLPLFPIPKATSGNNKDVSETCKCFLCGKYLSNQYNLRVHMETHEEAYHACQSCPHVSRSRDALRKHVSYRHPEEYQTRKRKKTDHLL